MSYTLAEVCDHCGLDLGQHLVPDSRCPTPEATTYFFMSAYHADYAPRERAINSIMDALNGRGPIQLGDDLRPIAERIYHRAGRKWRYSPTPTNPDWSDPDWD